MWIYLLRTKDKALVKFKEWKLLVENQMNKCIKTQRTENCLEFCNAEFDNFFKSSGMKRHKTVRHTPQHNGIVEHMNRTLLEKVRCMLIFYGLPFLFWDEVAVMIATYLVNLSTSIALDFKTLEHVWSSKVPNYRIFGCVTYSHKSKGKLEPRSIKCVFFGYPLGTKGYRLWVRNGQGFRVIISKDVIFDESNMPCKLKEPKTKKVSESKETIGNHR